MWPVAIEQDSSELDRGPQRRAIVFTKLLAPFVQEMVPEIMPSAELAKSPVINFAHSPEILSSWIFLIPLQPHDPVVCLFDQSHGVQSEDHLPLPVTSSRIPVLLAASE